MYFKKDLIDYINTTKYNTNAEVILSMVEDLKKQNGFEYWDGNYYSNLSEIIEINTPLFKNGDIGIEVSREEILKNEYNFMDQDEIIGAKFLPKIEISPNLDFSLQIDFFLKDKRSEALEIINYIKNSSVSSEMKFEGIFTFYFILSLFSTLIISEENVKSLPEVDINYFIQKLTEEISKEKIFILPNLFLTIVGQNIKIPLNMSTDSDKIGPLKAYLNFSARNSEGTRFEFYKKQLQEYNSILFKNNSASGKIQAYLNNDFLEEQPYIADPSTKTYLYSFCDSTKSTELILLKILLSKKSLEEDFEKSMNSMLSAFLVSGYSLKSIKYSLL